LTEGNYKSWNKESDALGKYQYLWGTHGKAIEKVTGVNSIQGFIDSPEAQEKYHKYNMETHVIPKAEKLKEDYSLEIPTEMVMGLIHFQGSEGARIYLDALSKTKSYDEAQKAIDANIKARMEKAGKPVPKNMKVYDYLIKLQENLKM
jgi:hypothetical protein